MTKTCCRCKETKPLDAFYSSKGCCKTCESASNKAKYWADPERARARNREIAARFQARKREIWKRNKELNPGHMTLVQRKANLMRCYGLEYDDFLAMQKRQGGVCAICKKAPSQDKHDRSWQVDHDHATGKVRGLLCRHCNWALGHFNDRIELLQAAIDYLQPFLPPGLYNPLRVPQHH